MTITIPKHEKPFMCAMSTSRPFCFVVLFLLFSTQIRAVPGDPSMSATIYFYSPETNIDNFNLLTAEFDAYLTHFGDYHFQPYKQKATMEADITGKNDCVLLISSWYYDSLKKRIPLRPILVGELDGQATQTRILSSKSLRSLASLRGRRLASSASREYTESILLDMLGDAELVRSIRITGVPKDLDALLAVNFGSVDAALTTEHSLQDLAGFNPRFRENMIILAQSQKLFRLILAVPQTTTDVASLLDLLVAMQDGPKGRNALNMLGLDALRSLEDPEKQRLESP